MVSRILTKKSLITSLAVFPTAAMSFRRPASCGKGGMRCLSSHTRSLEWLYKYYSDDISNMMQRRRDGIAEAFFDSIHHATNFKLDDELRRQLRRLADRAATLSDHLHASPATYELPPYEVWYDPKKSTVPRYSRETHEDMDRVSRPDDVYVACHALVWPGLSQHADERCQNVEDNARRVKSRIRVTTMPLPDD
ncbi:hypothetical protein KVT40_004782 [Elsinoe batatas]|uniref:Uncharacterized protein n=1 Tax=Elsinoe batatas TaxID=2601811 RepID=A0A8K0PJ30_9PEZI|nr:hypothetical protein KVT40_004782 [Elsinoe batatas]